MVSRLPVFVAALTIGLGLTWIGGIPFYLLLAAVAAGLLFEIFRAFRPAPPPIRLYRWPAALYALSGVISFLNLRLHGTAWPIFAVMAASVADTAAYLAGSAWGRTPLAPRVSPAKTVEGAVAGVVLAAAAVAWGLSRVTGVSTTAALIVAVLLALLAVLGDLLESMLKRRLGIKDFGGMLPGHGGLFDRLDSLLPVSIGMYFAMRIVLS